MMQHVHQNFVFSATVLIFFFVLCFQENNNSVFCVQRRRKSLADLFELGKTSYLENDWQSCVSNFEKSIKAYKSYITINTLCRRQCQNVPKQDLILAENASEELLFYEKKVLSTLCLLKCKFSQPDFVSADEFVHREQLFLHETFEAYNYLQLCYYQLKRYNDALEASFTYYIHHQNDEVAKSNIEYYMNQLNIPWEVIKNAESYEHTKLFYLAKESYEDENWSVSTLQFEEALSSFFIELENCRLLCEKSFDQGWFPDFVSSIANHFTFCLKCKTKCEKKLNNLDGDQQDDFIALVLFYLQFTYFKENEMQKAAECVASFQVLNTTDPNMINNKNYYLAEVGLKEDLFKPRQKIIEVDLQRRNEEKLLDFIEKKFVIDMMKARQEHFAEEIKQPKLVSPHEEL